MLCRSFIYKQSIGVYHVIESVSYFHNHSLQFFARIQIVYVYIYIYMNEPHTIVSTAWVMCMYLCIYECILNQPASHSILDITDQLAHPSKQPLETRGLNPRPSTNVPTFLDLSYIFSLPSTIQLCLSQIDNCTLTSLQHNKLADKTVFIPLSLFPIFELLSNK